MAISDGAFRAQVAKNTLEVLTDKGLRRIGQSNQARRYAALLHHALGPLTQGALGGAGILAASLINVDQQNLPSFVTKWFASMGIDGAGAAEAINEAIDTATKAIPRSMAESLDEEGIRGRIETMVEPGGALHGAFASITAKPETTVVNVALIEGTPRVEWLHVVRCRDCRNTASQGRPQYGGGITLVTQETLKDVPNIPPTTNNCCGPQIQRLCEEARRIPMVLGQLALLLGEGSLEKQIYDWFVTHPGAFSRADNEEFLRISVLNWHENQLGLLRSILRGSRSENVNQPDLLLNGLHTVFPPVPGLADILEHTVDASSRATVVIRGVVDGVVRNLDGVIAQQDADLETLQGRGLA
jgi:hypothetical protein